MQLGTVKPHSVHRALHTGDMTVMIGSPDVNAGVKTALLEFVAVVGDVGCKIGGIAVGADKHLVLLAAEFGCLVPECAVLLVGQTLPGENVDDLLHFTVVVQRAFKEPCVVGNAVFGNICLHSRNVFRKSIVNQRLAALFLRLVEIAVAVYPGKFLRQIHDVGSVVGILRQLHRFFALEELLIADVQREGELLYLVARIVYVEFAFDIITRVFENRRQAVAESAAAGVADVHRPCRIGGDEFHQHPLALAEIGLAVIGAVPVNAEQNVAEIAAADKEVDEAGACDLGAFDQRAGEVHAFADRLGNLAGRHSECLRRDHRRVGGKIAVRRVRRRFNGKGGSRNSGKHFVGNAASHRRYDDFFDLYVYFLYGISHCLFLSFHPE